VTSILKFGGDLNGKFQRRLVTETTRLDLERPSRLDLSTVMSKDKGSLIQSVLLYCTETWSLIKGTEKKFEASHLREKFYTYPNLSTNNNNRKTCWVHSVTVLEQTSTMSWSAKHRHQGTV